MTMPSIKSRNYGNLSKPAFWSHKNGAKSRGIEFRFTYDEWKSWWMTELDKKGTRTKRGVGKRQYGMCRILDRGPYALGNVRCLRPGQNKQEFGISIYVNHPTLNLNDTFGLPSAPCSTLFRRP